MTLQLATIPGVQCLETVFRLPGEANLAYGFAADLRLLLSVLFYFTVKG
jgi:hypothetical protein